MTVAAGVHGDVMRPLLERLAALRVESDRATHRTHADAAALLAARARALAAPAAEDASADRDGMEVLVFQVGTEQVAMPLSSIVAISRVGTIAPLPRVMRPVYGVTAWRGRPLTVLTLEAGRPMLGDESRLLVLGVGTRAALGVVVDAVDEVRRLVRADLSPAAGGPRSRYALGVTTAGLLVVDGDALLHPENLTA